jgi:hypothetical protein
MKHLTIFCFVSLTLLSSQSSPAVEISGFGGDGTGWTLNGGATVVNNVLCLTDAALAVNNPEARSAFFNNQEYITSFQVQFTYQATDLGGVGPGADGVAFVLQKQGLTALGNGGLDLGYVGISNPSAAFKLNIYPSYGPGEAFNTNGSWGWYNSVTPVDLRSNHPINVLLTYSNNVLHVYLNDPVTSTSYENQYSVDLPAILGDNTAYIGFTGATWSGWSTQTISNFSFSPVPEPSTFVMLGVVALSLSFVWRRKRAG